LPVDRQAPPERKTGAAERRKKNYLLRVMPEIPSPVSNRAAPSLCLKAILRRFTARRKRDKVSVIERKTLSVWS
jgi:hypothetical protein